MFVTNDYSGKTQSAMQWVETLECEWDAVEAGRKTTYRLILKHRSDGVVFWITGNRKPTPELQKESDKFTESMWDKFLVQECADVKVSTRQQFLETFDEHVKRSNGHRLVLNG